MYFNGKAYGWGGGDYVDDHFATMISRCTADQEVLLMWRGRINLRYLEIVHEDGTIEPFEPFMERVSVSRKICTAMRPRPRSPHTMFHPSSLAKCMGDSDPEVNACA
jgi:hypothetical protein